MNTNKGSLRNLTLGQMMQLCDPKLRRIPKEILEEGMLRHYFGDKIVPAKQRLLKRAVDLVCENPSSPNAAVSLRKARDYVFIMKETDAEAVGRALVKLREAEGQLTEEHAIAEDVDSTIEYFETRLKEWGKEVSNFQFTVSGPEMKPEPKPVQIPQLQIQKKQLSQDEQNKLNNDLLEAAQSGEVPRLKELLDKGADINARDAQGRTALMHAAWKNNILSARFLVDQGADVNVLAKGNWTVLMYASMTGHYEIAALLLERKADHRAENENNDSAFSLAARAGHVRILNLIRHYETKGSARYVDLTIHTDRDKSEVPAMPEKHSLQEALRKGITEGYKQTESEIEAKGETVTSTLFEVKMAEAGAKIIGQKPVLEKPKRKPVLLEGMKKGYKRKVKEMKNSGAADNTEVLMDEMSRPAIALRKPAIEERLAEAITSTAPVVGAFKKAALALGFLGLVTASSYGIYQFYNAPPKTKQEERVNSEEQRKQALFSRTLRYLKSNDPITRQRAITEIEQRKDKRYVGVLAIAILDEDDPENKKNAIAVLGDLGDPKAIQSLSWVLKDDDANVRIEAAKALSKIGHYSAIPELVGALYDQRSEVRYHAAEAIGQIAERTEDPLMVQPAVEPLKKLLKDKDPSVRYTAKEALGKMGYKKEMDGVQVPPVPKIKKIQMIKPPQKKAKKVLEKQMKRIEPPEALLSPGRIIEYGAPWCPPCNSLKKWIKEQGMKFNSRDAFDEGNVKNKFWEELQGAIRLYKERGGKYNGGDYPITIIDGKIFVSFSDEVRDAILKLKARQGK